MGSEYPVRIQSMTNTLTSDINTTVEQIQRIYKAGANYVRLTVPSLKDTEYVEEIIRELRQKKCDVPVIADIHFNPRIAMISASQVEKVRINPGNFADKKTAMGTEYSEDEYLAELDAIKEKLLELIAVCHKHKTALRIGTNHGSLSARIVDRYGDTPWGMVESAMEFLRICSEARFDDVVVSMKASNTRVMVYATRLLVKMMEEENMHFPLHLGVTEAGEGEDGRIKSAVGIGNLLADGIGDTIRVSLTEDPEAEIPVATKLVQYITQRNGHTDILSFACNPIDPYNYKKRETQAIMNIGGDNPPIVVGTVIGIIDRKKLEESGWVYSGTSGWKFSDTAPDTIAAGFWPDDLPLPENKYLAVPLSEETGNTQILAQIVWNKSCEKILAARNAALLHIAASNLTFENIRVIKKYSHTILVIYSDNANCYADLRAAVFRLMNAGAENPVIFKLNLAENNKEDFQLKASSELGGLFIDGLGNGIWLENEGSLTDGEILATAFGILQASRERISKTEYISCPSCGRTLFDIQSATQKIRKYTSHLKGLKIGIMGCIVNGPGEMADADYGYVGSGKGKVTLYKGKEVVKKNIPGEEAIDELIGLIKENGDWIEPEPPFGT